MLTVTRVVMGCVGYSGCSPKKKTERDLMFEDALSIPEIHATKTCLLCS